jgi:DNA-binding LacI/PurR family transcriptional regulator
VRSLGYVPNPAARSLVTRRTDSVAVIVPEPDDRIFSDPFFARTLRGVDRMLAANDLQLVLLLATPGAEGARTLRYLSHRHVDGAVVASHHRNDGPRRPPRGDRAALRVRRPAVEAATG